MFGAIGLSTHVWNNFARSALLLAGFPLLLVIMAFGVSMLFSTGETTVAAGFVHAWRQLPQFIAGAVVVSLVWFAIAWALHQRIVDWASGAHEVDRAGERRLWDLMEILCIARGETMPRLAIIESPARNAFASGLDRKRGAVTVTRGLVDDLDDRELSAVLAHELTHIRNGDARLGVIAAIFTGILTLGFDTVRSRRWFGGGTSRDTSSSSGSSSSGGGSVGSSSSRSGNSAGGIIALIGVVIIVVVAVLSVALRLALSRNREFLADAGAVQITGDADAMIAALQKVGRNPDLPEMPGQLQAILLEHPKGSRGASWWSTHPPMDQRIDALVRFAGGRLPEPLAVPPVVAPEAVAPLKPAMPFPLPLPIPGLQF